MNLKDLRYRYRLGKTLVEAIVTLHSAFIFVIDTLLLLITIKRQHTGSRRKLLVVKLDLIGDFILWLDFAQGLRELYPPTTYDITLLGNNAWTKLAVNTGLFERVVPLKRMRFILDPFYRLRELYLIRREGFDILIDPTYSREFQFTPPIARVCGAAQRMTPQGSGGNQRDWQKNISDRWYTKLLPSTPGTLMELCRNAEFLRALGHADFRARIPIYRPKAVSPLTIKEPYYVIFPGGSWANKLWPVENFADLAALINQATGLRGVVCGAPGEEHFGRMLHEATGNHLKDMIGRTTLDELAALIAGANFLVGNDTSAVHIAAAVSTPAVCILGGGHFGRFFPYQTEEHSDNRPCPTAIWHNMECYGCNYNCIHTIEGAQPYPCISRIPLKDVWQTVQKNIISHKR